MTNTITTDLTYDQITLAAVRMLTNYQSKDGRRFHPDATLKMIGHLIDARATPPAPELADDCAICVIRDASPHSEPGYCSTCAHDVEQYGLESTRQYWNNK